MLSCRNITVETVVPAVLRSPILFLFHVPVKPSLGNGTLMYTAMLVNMYVHVRSYTQKKPARFQAPPPAPRRKGGLGMGTRLEKSRRSRQSEHLLIRDGHILHTKAKVRASL